MLKLDIDYNFIFAILIRTLREFKCLNVSKLDSIRICKQSSEMYVSESVYYNMSLWPADCCREVDAANINIMLLRTVYICRVINSPSFNPKYIEDDIVDWIIGGAENIFLYEKAFEKYGMCILNALKKINKLYTSPEPTLRKKMKRKMKKTIKEYEDKVECFKEDCFIVL